MEEIKNEVKDLFECGDVLGYIEYAKQLTGGEKSFAMECWRKLIKKENLI